MLYDSKDQIDADGAVVFDVEARQRLVTVMSVNTDTGVVQFYGVEKLMRGDMSPDGQSRYRTIYPIFGGGKKPVLFHCYGQIP